MKDVISVDEIEKMLYKLITDVSDETERYVESKGRLIRLPMASRIDPIMYLVRAERGCIDCKKLRCENCERLWQT